MGRTTEDRLATRTRKAWAHAAEARADAWEKERSERTRKAWDRRERAARRAHVQALRLSDLMSEA